MIETGMQVAFIPHYRKSGNPCLNKKNAGRDTIFGTVCYINTETFYFTVAYKAGNTTLYESFKYEQIGTDVLICK